MNGEELLERLCKATEEEKDTEVSRAFMRIIDRVRDAIEQENKPPEKCPKCGSKKVNWSSEDSEYFCHKCNHRF